MLNYHLLMPSLSKLNSATFTHYLTLGSHHSNFQLDFITSLSLITLQPPHNLGQLLNNAEKKYQTAVVPLKGKIKIDDTVYVEEAYDKERLIANPGSVSTVE